MFRTLSKLLGRSRTRNAARPPRRLSAYRKFGLHLEYLESRDVPAPFTADNLVLFRAAGSVSNTTVSLVEIDEATAGQTNDAVQRIDVPGTGAGAIRVSGSATSTGYMSHTNDNTLLSFTGVNTTDTTSNVNTLNPRAVVTFDAAGTQAVPTTYTGISGNQTRSATSLNNTNWFIGDQGGIYTNGATSPSPSGNLRSVKPFGGTVYVFSASSSFSAVSTISAPSGGTITGLPGIPTAVSANQDFYLIQSGDNGTTYDVLYILAATSNTAGTINKYSLVSGSWVANGSAFTTTFGGFGLAAEDIGGATPGAWLYVSTGQGALTGNNVLRLTDSGGYNQALNINTANNLTLYTAPSGTIVKGLDFAPQTVGNAATTTVIDTITPTTVNYGAPVTLTATVSSASSTPTAGSMEFRAGVGGTLLATATSSTTSGNTRTFTVTSSTVPVGTFNNVVAVYIPGPGFNTSTSPAFGSTLTVTGTTTTTTLNTISPSSVTSGTAVNFSGSVVVNSGPAGNPVTGTVEIRNGGAAGTLLGSGPLDGSGNFAITSGSGITNPIPVGTYSDVRAYYVGQAAYIASNSAAQTLTVTDITTTGTALAAGDIAFTGYYGNNSPATSVAERFSFVLLRDVAAGTSVIFTDNGWDGSLATPAFARNEAVYVATFTNAYTAGSRFFYETIDPAAGQAGQFKNFDGTTTGLTTQLVGNLGFSNGGDNLFAVQGSLGSPTFLAGFSAASFISSGTPTTNTTWLPTGLTAGQTALALGNTNNNGRLDASNPNVGPTVSGTIFQIDGVVNTVANWQQITATNDPTVVPPAVAFNVTTSAAVMSFSAGSYSIAEGNSGTSQITITVVRSGDVSNKVSVNWATAPFVGPGAAAAGSDYVTASGKVTFNVSETTQTFQVTINGDTTPELNERFLVALSGPEVDPGSSGTATTGTPSTATVAILNDDGPTTLGFTPGDLVVYRVGDGTKLYGGTGNGASGDSAAIFLDEFGPDGFLLQTKPVPTSVSESISATSDGMLTLSADGHLVSFTGYATAPGTASVVSTPSTGTGAVERAIGTVDAAGVVTVNTTTTGYTGNNIRSAATVDGKSFYTAGTGAGNPNSDGVRFISQAGVTGQAGTIVNNTFNTRTVALFNGQLYWGTGSTFGNGPGVYRSGDKLPTVFTTDVLIVGDPVSGTNNGSPYQFTILDMDASGTLTAGDRLYFVDDRSAANGGGLYRSNFDGTNWSVLTAGTVVASNFTDVRGLTGTVVNGTTAQLFGSRAEANINSSGTSSFSTALLSLTDVTGSGGSWTTLTSLSGSGTTGVAVQQYRGVAVVPQAAGATASGLTLGAAPATSQSGTNVTLTATVTAGARGYVSFLNGTVVLGTAAINTATNTATLTFNNSILPPNVPTTISAYYGGDATYAAATATTTVTANGVITTTTVTSSNTGVAPVGPSVTITATVAPASGGLTTASGTVALTLNGAPLTSAVAPSYSVSGNNLVASFVVPTALLQGFTGGTQVNNLTPGITSITAAYTPASGDTSLASNGTVNQQVQAAAVGANNLVVYRTGNGVQSLLVTTGAAVFVDEVTPAGALVQSIAFPTVTTGAIHALLAQGQQSTDNQVTRSGDGSKVYVVGYESPTGFLASGDLRSVPNRTIGQITLGATPTVASSVSVSGLNTAGSNINTRGVYSPDGDRVYLGGSTGLFYVPSYTAAAGAATTAATAISTSVNVYAIGQLGNDLLITQNIATPSIGTFPGLPTGTAAFTQLTGFPTTQTWTAGSATGDPSRLMQPFFADLNPSVGFGGTVFDTIYVGSSQIFDASPLSKYSWNGTSWVLAGNIVGVATTTPGYNYLTGSQSGGTVTLYVTHDRGGSGTSDPQSTIYQVVDTNPSGSGFSGAPTVVRQNTQASNPQQYYRGIVQVTQSGAATTTTVTSNPVSPVIAGTPVTFTATVSGSPSVGTATFYAGPGLTNQIGSPVNVVGGTATSAATTTLPVGVNTITAVYSGGTGFAGSQGTLNFTVNPAPATFAVSSTTLLDAGGGFLITFNAPYDITALNLYNQDAGGTLDARDVQIVGPSLSFGGAAVDPNNFRFNAVPVSSTQLALMLSGPNRVTDANILATGNYTVTLRGGSGNAAFRRLSDGAFLDGNADGTVTAVDDYNSPTIAVTAPNLATTAIVTIADAISGPGQTITVPLILSGDVSDVTSVDLVFPNNLVTPGSTHYDVTAFTVNTAIPGIAAAFNPATGIMTMSSATPFQGNDNPLLLGNFTIRVQGLGNPGTAPPLGQKQRFDITVTSVADTAFLPKPFVGDDGLHVAGYLGDLSITTGLYNGADVSQLQSIITQSVRGLTLYQNLDPRLIADVNKDGLVNGADVSQLQARITNPTDPAASSVPVLPTGSGTTPTGGLDPYTYIDGTGITLAPGAQNVFIPIRVRNTDATQIGIVAADYVIEFDPNVFIPNNANFEIVATNGQAGDQTLSNGTLPRPDGMTASLFAIAWNVTAGITNPNLRTFRMTGSTAVNTGPKLDPGEDRIMYYLRVDLQPNATLGNTLLNMMDEAEGTFLANSLALPLALIPSPSNGADTGGTQPIDYVFTVSQPSVRLEFPDNFPANPGQTINVPLIIQTGPNPQAIAAVDFKLLFNPQKITINNVTAGDVADGTATGPTGGNAFTIAFNPNSTGAPASATQWELIATGSTAVNTGGTVPANTTTTVYILNITVNPSVTNGEVIGLNLGNTVTFVADNLALPVPIFPVPTNTPNEDVDGSILVSVQLNQPPFVNVPGSSLSQTANPIKTLAGRALVFAPANGNAITVSDPNGNDTNVRVTLSVPTGTLTLGSTASVTVVSGNGTGTVVVEGTPANLTAALNGLVFRSPTTFFGNVLLSIVANDQSTNFGGPLQDQKSVNITVVRLFLNEIMFNPPGTDAPNEYVEIRSSIPNFEIPVGTFLVGIEANGTSATNGASAGAVNEFFNIGAMTAANRTTGSNGLLVLRQNASGYSGAGADGATVVTSTASGWTGTNMFWSTNNTGGTDIENAGTSFLLLSIDPDGIAPSLGTDIDAANNGTINGTGATAYNSWRINDSVSFLLTTDSSVSTSPNFGYAAVNFRPTPTGAGGASTTGTVVTYSSTVLIGYGARVGNSTGATFADWILASDNTSPSIGIAGTAPNWSFGTANVFTGATGTFAGRGITQQIGRPNFFINGINAVQVNGGGAQRSQITSVVVRFFAPVTTVNAADISLTGWAGAVATSVALAGDGLSATITFTGGADTYALANPFNGSSVALLDGRYRLQIGSGAFSDAAGGIDIDGDGSAGGTLAFDFHRFFGDTDGDADVDATDRNFFNAMVDNNDPDGTGSPDGVINSFDDTYFPFLDYSNNNDINRTTTGAGDPLRDYANFLLNFRRRALAAGAPGAGVPASYLSFGPRI